MTDHAASLRFPKLRTLDIQAVNHGGQPALVLRDPLQLSGNYMVVPQELGPALMLFNGASELTTVRAVLRLRFGLPVDQELLEYLVEVLDANFLLDNERALEAQQRALAAYRAAPFRTPSMAGQSYPADGAELRQLLDGYLARAANQNGHGPAAEGRGVISPHIDYPRGGHVYAAVWRQAQEMAAAADLVVLLGTDHFSMGDRLTLTRQNYATPYGLLPTDTATVDALAGVIGEEAAFSGELRHRGEHSLELVATWLHHMRGGQPVAMVPILTGSFADFIADGADPAQDATLNRFVDTLRSQIAGRRALVIASGDLAHVGPAFGGPRVDEAGRRRIQEADRELMAHLAAGSPADFFGAIQRVRDSNNVCGVSPFYLLLRLLGEAEGRTAAYDQCPADGQNTSLVSVCGMIFG